MTSTAKTTRTAIKNLMQGRVQLAERLASQLERVEASRAERSALDNRIAAEAATARGFWDDCLAAGWAARELTTAGLKPPAAPRPNRTVTTPEHH